MLFDKIIYINLKHRKDRNKNVLNVLSSVSKYPHDLLSMTMRFEAVYGKSLNLNLLNTDIISKQAIGDAIKNTSVYTTMTIGGIGCALSHYYIYKYIIANNINKCLILEDDISMDADFINKCIYINKQLDAEKVDFDLLFLGYHDTSDKYSYKHTSTFNKFNRIYGLFGYIVSYKGAQKLLSNIFPLVQQIDSEISNKSNKINIIGVNNLNKIIISDQSDVASKFGTDIQIMT